MATATTAPSTVWEQQFSADGKDVDIHSAWQTSDGGYILAGSDYNSDPSVTGVRTCLIKTDASGNKLWEKFYDGDLAYSIVQTSDGGYVFTANGGGSSTAWLVKTDAAGNKQWDLLYDTSSLLYSVKQTSDGGYIASGYRDTGIVNDEPVLLLKVDANGKKLWEKTYDYGYFAYGYGVWPTSDGGYAIAGEFPDPVNNLGLIKTDVNGVLQWNKTYNGITIYAVQQTRDGGYVLVGQNGQVFKLDPSGNVQWSYDANIGGDVFSVQQTWDGGYVVCGNGDSITVVKLDGSGTEQWRKTLDPAVDTYHMDYAGSIQQIGTGNFIIGWTTGTSDTNSKGILINLSSDMTPVPNAQFVSDTIPSVMDAGKSYQVSITFLNDGTKPWTFQDNTTMGGIPGSDAANFGATANQTVQIGTIVRPGQSYTFSFPMTAPAMNGSYYPEFRMAWESHSMFGDTDLKNITVVNGAPDTRHAQPPAALKTPSGTATVAAASSQTVTATAVTAPTEQQGPAPSQKKSNLPCVSALLPMLVIGIATTGVYMRRNKGNL